MINANNWLDVLTNSLMPTTRRTQKLDLTKKEDLNTFNEMIADLRTNVGEFSPFMKAMFGDAFTSTLDELEASANKVYADAHKNCGCTRKECDCTETTATEPIKPSTNTSEEMQAQITKLVTEYVDTMIRPYADVNNLTEECINNAKDGLFEFACWIYNR